MGYIYQADVYCDRCGDAIRKQLAANAPTDTLDHSSYDSDAYPKDADVQNDESDCPELAESLEARATWLKYVAWVEERVGC